MNELRIFAPYRNERGKVLTRKVHIGYDYLMSSVTLKPGITEVTQEEYDWLIDHPARPKSFGITVKENIMDNKERANEIKKFLYKENPVAEFNCIKKGVAIYEIWYDGQPIIFMVPVADMGDASFKRRMDSKLLIRWLTVLEGESNPSQEPSNP